MTTLITHSHFANWKVFHSFAFTVLLLLVSATGLAQNNCEDLTSNLNYGSGPFKVDQDIVLLGTASGGSPPYDFAWDLNNDGVADTHDAATITRYATAYNGPITLTVTDSAGCQAEVTASIAVSSPQIDVLSDAAGLVQVCGNNDGVIDPGERWKLPVTLKNNGPVTATAAYAVFGKRQYANDFAATDFTGNALAACDYDFVDIGGTGTLLSFNDPNPNDTIPGNDDGATGVITLPQPFKTYGETHTRIVMSSNGYLSLDEGEDGTDYDNDCPLPHAPDRGGNGVRIMPMHDDLIVNGGAWYQHFSQCPRAAETGSNLACDVFQWDDVKSKEQPGASMKFQAILYPATGQWVFQYATDGSTTATVGLLNRRATEALAWSCNEGSRITAESAVCAYPKDHKPGALLSDKLYLETPALALGDLAADDQIAEDLVFSIDKNARCNSAFAIDYEAAVFDEGFNRGNTGSLVSARLGNNGVCHPVANCEASPPAVIPRVGPSETNFRYGMWWNPRRSGNGLDIYITGDRLWFVQYTADEAQKSVWYISDAPHLRSNQARNRIIRKSYPNGFVADTSQQVNQVVGHALTTFFIESEDWPNYIHGIQVREINGHFSAEKIEKSAIDDWVWLGYGDTGMWWRPAENGWGISLNTHGEFIQRTIFTTFLYDDSGQPYWLQGYFWRWSSEPSNPKTADLKRFEVFCPHCPWVPLKAVDTGHLRMVNWQGGNPTHGLLEELDVTITDPEQPVHWHRSNLNVKMLTPYAPPD
jgi:hypothetical protein